MRTAKKNHSLHEADMDRFRDILILSKIKKPRKIITMLMSVWQAKAAMEEFDLALDETLRKLNGRGRCPLFDDDTGL